MPRPLSTADGYLEHEIRARLSVRQKGVLDRAVRVLVADEKKMAKAEGRRAVPRTQADVLRLALDHLVETHPMFDNGRGKKNRKG